jgi:hypothetical protein
MRQPVTTLIVVGDSSKPEGDVTSSHIQLYLLVPSIVVSVTYVDQSSCATSQCLSTCACSLSSPSVVCFRARVKHQPPPPPVLPPLHHGLRAQAGQLARHSIIYGSQVRIRNTADSLATTSTSPTSPSTCFPSLQKGRERTLRLSALHSIRFRSSLL